MTEYLGVILNEKTEDEDLFCILRIKWKCRPKQALSYPFVTPALKLHRDLIIKDDFEYI